MATRSLVLTLEERRFLNQLVARAWAEADTARLLARIDSPQEASALADQQFIESIQAKLRDEPLPTRTSGGETPTKHPWQ